MEIIKIVLNWAIPIILTAILTFMKKIVNDNNSKLDNF